MSKHSMNQASELPPPYHDVEWAHLTDSSLRSQEPQPNSGYAPVQYNLAGQDPLGFYEALIDASNYPSEIFCRMADALFFHMDQHCNQFRGTNQIEPAKIAWLGVALGQDAELSKVVQDHLPSLYDAASIPYSFNNTQTPVLDRRGHLHLCVFEVCADHAYARLKWNKTLNILKLHDPLTNLPFPTPIPHSAFPSVSDRILNQVYTNWQQKASLHMSSQVSNPLHAHRRRKSAANNYLGTSSTAQVPQAVPAARRAAFQTTQPNDGSGGFLPLATSRDLQARTSELAQMAQEMNVTSNSDLGNSSTAQPEVLLVPQTVSIARLAAFQTVGKPETEHMPAAKSSFKVHKTPQDPHVSYTQAAPTQTLGVSRQAVDNGRINGQHKSPTAQVQQAVSIARRAAFQTVKQVEKL